MDLNEFVSKVFLRFPPDLRGDDTEESIMYDYINALESLKEYNYEQAFKELMISYSFKTLPTAKILHEILERNVIKREEQETGKFPEFKSLWAFKNGHWFEYGIEPQIGEHKTVQALIKQGFTNITNQNPYWSKDAI